MRGASRCPAPQDTSPPLWQGTTGRWRWQSRSGRRASAAEFPEDTYNIRIKIQYRIKMPNHEGADQKITSGRGVDGEGRGRGAAAPPSAGGVISGLPCHRHLLCFLIVHRSLFHSVPRLAGFLGGHIRRLQ